MRKRAKKLSVSSYKKWAVAGGVASLAATVQAIAPEDVLVFSKGPVTLRPQLDLTAQFNDNVFFRDTNRESDFLSIISPGLEFEVGREENFLRLDYNWDHYFYAENDELNADQHRLNIQNQFRANDFSITGRDKIEFLSSVLSGGISIRNAKVERAVYLDEYRFKYDITDKTDVYLEAFHNTVDYDHAALFDSTTLMGSLGFSWQAFHKTSIFSEVYYGQTDRELNSPGIKPPGSWNLGGYIGARGEFTRKLTGTVKAGYETREFEDDLGGATSPVVSVGLTEAFTEKSILRLNYTRQTYVSAEFVRSQFTADVVDLSFTQWIGDDGRFRATAGGRYDMASYEGDQISSVGPVDRSDDLWRAYLTLNYDLTKWSSLLLGYEFEKFSSSHPDIIDYHANRVTLTVAFGY